MEEQARYIIGIDLGTTHTVVAYVDTDLKKNPSHGVQLFKIPQFIDIGRIEARPLLPSFYYLASENEFPQGALQLPWEDKKEKLHCIGAFAQECGAQVPTKIVQSAKSWLSNPAASRKEKILPFEAAEEGRKISPLEASSSYLSHLKEAWNAAFAKENEGDRFEEQDIIVTVPASFDEIARTLTLEAAKNAGLSRLILVEEPQAAFYNWLMENESSWRQIFQEGDRILICDVGGGTTDFTWINATKNENEIVFQRNAVGEHLLLGGDNMDNTVAHFLEKKFEVAGTQLDFFQLQELKHQARKAKEALLGKSSSSTISIWVSGSGSQVVGGGRGTELKKAEVENLLLTGFFGLYPFSEATCLNRKSGIRVMGLPYETEPSITKHLAAFLLKNKISQKPSHILFNGGVLKYREFQKRFLQSLDMWFPDQKNAIIELKIASLDVAVAKGAAYFGKSRRGLGVRVEGGSSRGFYLEIDVKTAKAEKERRALTLLPKGSLEGVNYISDYLFSLLPNTPVCFQLYHSNTRSGDAKGALVPIIEQEMSPLPPLHTLLRYGNKYEGEIPVHIGVHLTEVGTLELWVEAQQTAHRWNLEFQVRGMGNQEILPSETVIESATFAEASLIQSKNELLECFSPRNEERLKGLIPSLEKILGLLRNEWPLSILRGLFDMLMQQLAKKDLSLFYESRFWNLAGFFLRPGCGYPLDDFRIKELWKIILADFNKVKPEEVQIQQWICFRRIAGGLSRGQQTQLFNAFLPSMLSLKADKREYAYVEKLRALASLELVDPNLKIKLGNILLKKICERKATAHDYWALGRLGARQLLWGSAGNVVPRTVCEKWVKELLKVRGSDQTHLSFTLSLLAQKIDLREINLSDALIQEVTHYMKAIPGSELLLEHMITTSSFTHKEKERIFGDSLPPGLTLTPI